MLLLKLVTRVRPCSTDRLSAVGWCSAKRLAGAVMLTLPCSRCSAAVLALLLCWCVRRRATTTINDGASIPDTLNTPRSSIDPVSQEVLLDLLDTWGAR